MSAVLAANMLAIVFVWCAINVGKRERAQEPLGTYVWGMVAVLLFSAGAMYLAFGGT